MPCIEVSTDTKFCKEWNGIRIDLDFSVDTFDTSIWELTAGAAYPTHDTVNGWLDVGGATGLGFTLTYVDPSLTQPTDFFVVAECYSENSNGYLAGCIAASQAGDAANHNYAMKHGTTSQRMQIGRRVAGVDGGVIPVVGTNEGVFYTQSLAVVHNAPNTQRYASDNDTNWTTTETNTNLAGRTGYEGLRVWRIGAGTQEVRIRAFRSYEGDNILTSPFDIAFQNIPHNHRIHIYRDADGATDSLDNTSGVDATMTFNCLGYPISNNTEKRVTNPPWTRCYLTTIAAPAVKLAEFVPTLGVNWGDVYDFDANGGFQVTNDCDCEEGSDPAYGDCEEGISGSFGAVQTGVEFTC